jgi:hypothetical protein
MLYCFYYQAQVQREKMWFLVASLRSFEHLLFDRNLDKDAAIFEFFVSPDLESYFLAIMDHFAQQGIISNLQKLPHRLENAPVSLTRL